MRTERKNNCFITFLSYITVFFCLMSIAACGSTSAARGKGKNSKVVAKVNGQPIYEDQLAPAVEKSLRKFKKYGMRKDSADLVERLKKKALNKVINQELINQESQKLKVEGLDQKIEQKLQAIRKKYQTKQRFDNYLKANNYLKMKGLRESLGRRVRVDEHLRRQGISEPEISEELLKEYYDSNPNSYHREESIKVSHILIEVGEEAGPEEKEKALKKAQQIRKEVLEGKDFGETAKMYSDCNSASGGGSLRYKNRGYMPEAFDKTAFAMEIDSVSDVVETKFGYHIIKVFDKIPAGPTPYQEVRGFIKKFFQEQESKKMLAAHIAVLKEKAKIEIFLDETPG